jgi:hypothetical protein
MSTGLYHINSKGEAGKCTAKKGGCPFGDAEQHYTSSEAAREAYEEKNEKAKKESLTAWKRKPKPKVSKMPAPVNATTENFPSTGHGAGSSHGRSSGGSSGKKTPPTIGYNGFGSTGHGGSHGR